MGQFTRQQAADRAGVSHEDLDRFVELQLVVPDSDDRLSAGDVRKIGLIDSLVAGGIPLDGMAEAHRVGHMTLDFLDDPSYEHFSALGKLTFVDLSAQTGIPVELLLVIREAIGSAVAQPTDLVREIELGIVPMIEAELAMGYPADAVERGLRTMGDSLRRAAVSEADAFAMIVMTPAVNRPGATGADISRAAVVATQRIRPTVDSALLAIYHAQQAHAWTTNIMLGFERALRHAGLVAHPARPPAMCFLDVTGYTRLTAERGDAAAGELAEQLRRMVQRTSVQHGGRPVKWLGDGVMFHFRDPGPGVVAALEMAEAMAPAGLPPAHVGLHAGPVLVQDGDYYGATVNIAARIAEYARPGEVLVSHAVVEATSDAPVSFAEVGMVELKGVSEPVRLHIAHKD
ncbi:MAG: adenylate/guanylate cyclase domain-containing protein [Chloroflexota bacterium]